MTDCGGAPVVACNSVNHALLTDLYQITMAQGYWEEGKTDELASFYMFFRENPFEGGYTIACGIEQVVELVEGFAFTDDDIAYLAGLPAPAGGLLFKPEFLDYLAHMQLEVDIDAVEEGELVFPREPIVRVNGPILQCQLLETALLNCVNFQTLIATKAARVCRAAQGPVAEFGLRRAQGPDGGNSASRAAYIGGCVSTSNVLAGKLYDIPVSGTHAHSWVMAFDSELEAFRAYARIMPNNCVLLVDTYDVQQGVKNAITVAGEMEGRGEHLAGIRIDSGDLAWLSCQARMLLDKAGYPQVKIVASNNLDEYTISSLKDQKAAIDSWGVGTRLATAYDQAALGGVYKLSALYSKTQQRWIPRIKATESVAKATIPGMLSVKRFVSKQGFFAGDMVIHAGAGHGTNARIIDPLDKTRQKDLSAFESYDLLKPIIRAGKTVRVPEHISKARERAQSRLSMLDPSNTRLLHPHSYPVGLEPMLYQLREDLLMQVKGLQIRS